MRLGQSVMGYLVEARGLDPSRFAPVAIGPAGASPAVEIWVGSMPPPSAIHPTPRSDNFTTPTLFDAYTLTFNCEMGAPPGWENARARLGGFAEVLARRPELRGVIVTFESRAARNEGGCPRFTRAEIDAELNYLRKTAGLEHSRMSVRQGGRAQHKMIELWLLPKGTGVPRHAAATIDQVDGRCRE